MNHSEHMDNLKFYIKEEQMLVLNQTNIIIKKPAKGYYKMPLVEALQKLLLHR